jgi:hypothetical protein
MCRSTQTLLKQPTHSWGGFAIVRDDYELIIGRNPATMYELP